MIYLQILFIEKSSEQTGIELALALRKYFIY